MRNLTVIFDIFANQNPFAIMKIVHKYERPLLEMNIFTAERGFEATDEYSLEDPIVGPEKWW